MALKALRFCLIINCCQYLLQDICGNSGCGIKGVGLIERRFGVRPGFATKWTWTLGKPLPLTVLQFLQVYSRVRNVPSACVGVGVTIIHSPFPVKGSYIPAMLA